MPRVEAPVGMPVTTVQVDPEVVLTQASALVPTVPVRMHSPETELPQVTWDRVEGVGDRVTGVKADVDVLKV
jgi:hypothetical protein